MATTPTCLTRISPVVHLQDGESRVLCQLLLLLLRRVRVLRPRGARLTLPVWAHGALGSEPAAPGSRTQAGVSSNFPENPDALP